FLSKPSLPRSPSTSHAPVIDITARLDTHSSDYSRVDYKRSTHPRSVQTIEVRQDACLQGSRQRSGALYFGRVPREFQFDQALKVREQCEAATAFGFEDFLHCLANPALIQQSVTHAHTEQLLGFTPELFGIFHSILCSICRQLLCCFLSQAL